MLLYDVDNFSVIPGIFSQNVTYLKDLCILQL